MTQADIYEKEVEPRIARMRERVRKAFGGQELNPVQLHPHDDLSLDRWSICRHALWVCRDIEQEVGPGDRIRVTSHFFGETPGTYALHRIQCMEWMLLSLKLYSRGEIEQLFSAKAAAA